MIGVDIKAMKTTTSNQPNYFPQMDALRFLAVLGVMGVHNWHPKRLPWLLGDMDMGGFGVRLFFVLSGFLITGILLRCRDSAGTSSQSSFFLVRQFYIRRFLRIFPIYYLVIFLAYLFNVPTVRETWGWLVTYGTNFYITFFDTWPGRMGHFWTLAVEEHFYLIWPWLVLFAPRKWLIPSILVAIAIGPVYRAFAYVYFPAFDIGAMDFKAATLTPASLDILGVGALLSLLWNSSIPKESIQKILTRLFLPIALILYFICLMLYHYRIKPSMLFVFSDIAMALIFAWVIHSAAIGFKGGVGKFLEFRPLSYLGRISYGMYVYHNLMPLVLIPIFRYFGLTLEVPGLLNFILTTLLTIGISSLSWHFFELPINNLKRYFQYKPKSSVSAPEPDLVTGEIR